MSPRSIEVEKIHRTQANADWIRSCYPNETTKPKSKFPNHTLVIHDSLKKSLNSELKSTPNEQSLNYNSGLIEYKPDTYSSKAKERPLQGLKCEQNMTTLMPNTSEFKTFSLNESLHKSKKLPSKSQQSTSSHKSKCKPSSWKCAVPNWKIIFGILWAFSFTVVMIYQTMINGASTSGTEKRETIVFKPSNYELCLLIGRNFRRLIVSSIHAVQPNNTN